MVADLQGNDIGAVGVPVTGFIGYAPLGTAIPTPAQGADPDYTLPNTYKKLGLIKVDGGPQWSESANGDALEFWQSGYSIPTGLADVTVAAGLAQTDENTRSFLRGKTADGNGYMTIDGGGNALHYVIFTEEIFKNGFIRRRAAPDANISAMEENQSTRGEILGYDTTVKINNSDLVDGGHYGEWYILPESDAS
jgi:hypothetical protein